MKGSGRPERARSRRFIRALLRDLQVAEELLAVLRAEGALNGKLIDEEMAARE
jgi:hypothetical protein